VVGQVVDLGQRLAHGGDGLEAMDVALRRSGHPPRLPGDLTLGSTSFAGTGGGGAGGTVRGGAAPPAPTCLGGAVCPPADGRWRTAGTCRRPVAGDSSGETGCWGRPSTPLCPVPGCTKVASTDPSRRKVCGRVRANSGLPP